MQDELTLKAIQMTPCSFSVYGMVATNIWKVTSKELLTKQAMTKVFVICKKIYNLLYAKNMYIPKLLFKMVTAEVEAHVISGRKLLYAFVISYHIVSFICIQRSVIGTNHTRYRTCQYDILHANEQ
jgi:hypothetical protein